MVILCLFPSKAFAELGLIKTPDGHVRLAGVISSRPNGIITAKVIGGNYVHGTAESLSLRSAASGAVSSSKVPATISRTASLAKVAQNIHGKLRFARFTPQGLIGSLILGEILQQLIDNGYTYDEATGTMIKDGRTVVCMAHTGSCIDPVKKTVLDNKYAVYDRVLGNPTQQQLERLCSTIKRENINTNLPLAMVSANIIGGECVVKTITTERSGHIAQGSVYNFRFQVHILPSQSSALTEAEFQRILEPIAAQNPTAVLQAADLSDSDWSAPKVHVLPGTIVNSQPFTDPSDGKAKQARWEFYDCGDGQSCVRETLTDRPDLQPNSPAAPAPDNPPATGTDTAPGGGDSAGNNAGSGSQSAGEGQQEKEDLCRKYPHIMACDEQPEPMDAGDLSLPQKTVQIDFQPENRFPTDGQCPAPVTFQIDIMGASKTFAWEFTQACEVASRLRYLIIALAWVVAGFFCIRTVSSSI